MGGFRAGGLTGLMNQPSAQVIDGSLKFDKSKSQYLQRTPGSAGNRSVYTGSAWVKRTAFAPENNSNSNHSTTPYFLLARIQQIILIISSFTKTQEVMMLTK